MQAHGRFEQEAVDATTRDARHLPRLRAAARAARALHPRRGSDRRALRAADHPAAVPDRSRPTRAAGRSTTPIGFGPVAVGRAGARAGRDRAPGLPAARATGSTSGPGERGRAADARSSAAGAARANPGLGPGGSILVTYPAEHVADGLGDVPERERPLEATLWGRPRLDGPGAAGRRDRDPWRRPVVGQPAAASGAEGAGTVNRSRAGRSASPGLPSATRVAYSRAYADVTRAGVNASA